MQTSRYSKPCITASNVLSIVFSQLFMPVYAMVIALTATPLLWIPLRTRLMSLGVVALLTAVLPILLLYSLKAAGKISDIDITNRKQRTLPILMMLFCYGLTLWYIIGVHAPAWLVMFFVGGIASVIVLGIVTVVLKWKISMHGAGMGAIIGFVFALMYYNLTLGEPLWLLIVAVLVAGLVGSARIILNKHTIWQVVAGTTVAAVITWGAVSLAIPAA